MKNLILLILLFVTGYLVYSYQHDGGVTLSHITQSVGTQMQKLQPVPVPNADISALADKARMTEKAKDIFYRAEPIIVTDRSTFETDCQTPISRNSVELGCYTSENKIYLLNITDPKLSDEMVVTASHEMLHAAYQQLDTNTKAIVDSELEMDLPDLEDKSLARELVGYQQTEPGERDNELHSILGTEYSPLDSNLETYYAQYFTNRATVVSFAKRFDNTFSSLENQLTSLLAEIRQTRVLMRQDVRRRDISDYNALVPQINSTVEEYNTQVDEYNQLSRSLKGQESTDVNSSQ